VPELQGAAPAAEAPTVEAPAVAEAPALPETPGAAEAPAAAEAPVAAEAPAAAAEAPSAVEKPAPALVPKEGMDFGVPEHATPVQLFSCEGCGRKFNEKAFSKHTNICKKVFQSKRKAYDSRSNRAADGAVAAAKTAGTKLSDPATMLEMKKQEMAKQRSLVANIEAIADPPVSPSQVEARVEAAPAPKAETEAVSAPSPAAEGPQGESSPVEKVGCCGLTSPKSRTKKAKSPGKNVTFAPSVADNEPVAPEPEKSGTYDLSALQDTETYQAPTGAMVACDGCGRKFNEQAFARHAKICKKVFQEKRKAYDPSKARAADGARAASTASTSVSTKGKEAEKKAKEAKEAKKAAWKARSAQLRAAIKAGKGDGSVDVPLDTSDLIPCPHCKRTFNQRAAERHIPRCQTMKAKPTLLKRGGGKGAHSARTAKGKPEAKAKDKSFFEPKPSEEPEEPKPKAKFLKRGEGKGVSSFRASKSVSKASELGDGRDRKAAGSKKAGKGKTVALKGKANAAALEAFEEQLFAASPAAAAPPPEAAPATRSAPSPMPSPAPEVTPGGATPPLGSATLGSATLGSAALGSATLSPLGGPAAQMKTPSPKLAIGPPSGGRREGRASGTPGGLMQKFNDLRQRYNEYKKNSSTRHSLGGSPLPGTPDAAASAGGGALVMTPSRLGTPGIVKPGRAAATPVQASQAGLKQEVEGLRGQLREVRLEKAKLELEFERVKSEKLTVEAALEGKTKENERLRALVDELMGQMGSAAA